MSMQDLKGKTVLVTGAALGIGRALSVGLHEAGANLVLVDLLQEPLLQVAAQLGQRAYACAMDISDPQAAHKLHGEVRKKFGAVDVLVNNAAIGPERNSPRFLVDKPKFWTTPDELWLATLRVNVFGAQLMSRTFVQDMVERRWGRIVNITTSLDTMYRQGIGAYGPCKAALEAATRIMAQDLQGTGVTATVLVPGGPVNTRMVPQDNGLAQEDLIQPEQMLAPLLWLCTDEATDHNAIRIIARHWNNDQPLATRLLNATAPVAWPQLGAQSVFPTAARSAS